MTVLKLSELQLADQVTRDGMIGVATVSQIKDGMVHFFRPYTHTADFSYTGGVICYVGIEQWSVERDRDIEYTLIERKSLR